MVLCVVLSIVVFKNINIIIVHYSIVYIYCILHPFPVYPAWTITLLLHSELNPFTDASCSDLPVNGTDNNLQSEGLPAIYTKYTCY